MSRRLVRALIRLFPAETRDSHGREIEQVLRDQHRERPPGILGTFRFWAAAVIDVLRVAPRQHAEALAQDARYAVRGLRRSPAFTLVALSTIALGTGATSGVFTVVNGVLLRPLPYAEPDRVVLVWTMAPEGSRSWLSPPEIEDIAERASTLDGVAGLTDLRLALTGSGSPEELEVIAASERLFPLLGTRAEIGRLFEPADDVPSAARVVVLSHGLWMRRFGGDRAVLGTSVRLDGRAYTVIGVLPAAFGIVPPSSVFPQRVDAWVPLQPHLTARARDVRYLHAVARVRPDVPITAARDEVVAIGGIVSSEFSTAYRGRRWSFELVRMQDDVVSGVRPALLVLFATVGMVLVIASGNVATLLLVRGEARRRELAIRTALGASESRLVRQLITEGLVLALLGGILGVGLAAAVPRIARARALASLPRFAEVSVDWRVVAFTLAVSVAAGLLFTLAPLLRRSRRRTLLVEPPGGSRGSVAAGRIFAAAEIALASMVLVVALILGRSFARLLDAPPGFEPARLLSARVALPPRYATAEDLRRFFESAIDRIAGQPAIESAAAISQLPLSGAMLGSTFTAGAGPSGEPVRIDGDLRGVTPHYFDVMRIPLVDGRGLLESDRAQTPMVAIVDEAMARRLSPDGHVVGRRIRWIRQPEVDIEIVGVAGSVRHRNLDDEPRPTVYRPISQYPRWTMTLVARTSGDPALSATALVSAIRDIDPNQPISELATMDSLMDRSMARPGFGAAGGAVLALLALSLAVVGVYGLLAFVVAQRRREVGVRMALGATRGDIVRMFLRDGLRLAAVGIVLGLAGAGVLGRWAAPIVPGVAAVDLWTVAVAAATVMLSALLACWLPARRAGRVDPSIVLRDG